jgi:ATP-dependent Clp protease ATP-binding subunit ClpC
LISNNKSAMGFAGESAEKGRKERIKNLVNEEIKKFFKPEFINRIDEIIIFDSLNEGEIKEIARRMLSELEKRCENGGVEISFDESIVDAVSKKGFDTIYGARPLRRAVTSMVEDPLAEKYLIGEFKDKTSVVCRWDGEKITIS